MDALRVLLVEDSEADAELILRALKGTYSVQHERVDTGEAMLQALAAHPWDVVISDFSMPHFDGFSAIALLRQKQPDTPIILVSGTIGEETAVEAMRAGAKDYLMKDKLTRLAPAVARELTESAIVARLRESEEQLRQAQKMEVIGHMAGCIAHDFNNVLSVVIMYCDSLLAAPDVSETVRKAIEQIRKSGMRAASLTRQLLAFSRKQILEPKVLVLNSIVSDFEKMLQRLVGEKVELSLDLVAEAWNVKVDPGQVEQIIMNLGVNARDAMPEGGKLSVRTSNVTVSLNDTQRQGLLPGSYILLTVTDTGCGMDIEVQKRIFDPFFTTKGPEKGTGLGLSTVYGIVKQSSGFIYVRSAPGQGTAFEVFFPRVDLPLSPQKKESSASQAVKRSATVMIMDDQEDVRDVLANALRKSGYEVLVPTSGDHALSLLKTHKDKLRLLITDVVMPTISGPELAKHFLSASPNINVVFVSGYLADELDKYELMEDRCLFLQKPFSLQQLLGKVNEGLT